MPPVIAVKNSPQARFDKSTDNLRCFFCARVIVSTWYALAKLAEKTLGLFPFARKALKPMLGVAQIAGLAQLVEQLICNQ